MSNNAYSPMQVKSCLTVMARSALSLQAEYVAPSIHTHYWYAVYPSIVSSSFKKCVPSCGGDVDSRMSWALSASCMQVMSSSVALHVCFVLVFCTCVPYTCFVHESPCGCMSAGHHCLHHMADNLFLQYSCLCMHSKHKQILCSKTPAIS